MRQKERERGESSGGDVERGEEKGNGRDRGVRRGRGEGDVRSGDETKGVDRL